MRRSLDGSPGRRPRVQTGRGFRPGLNVGRVIRLADPVVADDLVELVDQQVLVCPHAVRTTRVPPASG